MAENLKDTLKSLLTKLSAVRVTLTDEEQSLLDQLILSSNAEVKAHAIAFAPDEAVAKAVARGADEARAAGLTMKPDEAKAAGKLMSADEAKAAGLVYKPDEAKAAGKLMSADEAKAAGLAFKPDEAKTAGRLAGADEAVGMRMFAYKPEEALAQETDEVNAHSMPASLMTKPGFPNPVWVKIVYDPEMECYKVV